MFRVRLGKNNLRDGNYTFTNSKSSTWGPQRKLEKGFLWNTFPMWFRSYGQFGIISSLLKCFFICLFICCCCGSKAEERDVELSAKESLGRCPSRLLTQCSADQMPSCSVIFVTQCQLIMLQTKARRRKGTAGHVQSRIFWCLFQNCCRKFSWQAHVLACTISRWAAGFAEPPKAKHETRCQEGGGQNKRRS